MLKSQIETIFKTTVERTASLHGGNIAQVYRVDLADGRRVVAKTSHDRNLHIEGDMLRDLAPHLPVPAVHHAAPELLIMDYVRGDSRMTPDVQAHAADLLADLHAVRGDYFGYPRDTLIGGLHQPNPPTSRWVDFFRDHRLLYMADEALKSGHLPAQLRDRLDKFAARIADYIDEPPYPALLHGDVWTTNVLAENGRVTGFIDPAIYYGHPEIELAFSTLFGTFGDPFFNRYRQHHDIMPGFFEAGDGASRRDTYNLYPLLVHVRLFGVSYAASVDRILRANGF